MVGFVAISTEALSRLMGASPSKRIRGFRGGGMFRGEGGGGDGGGDYYGYDGGGGGGGRGRGGIDNSGPSDYTPPYSWNSGNPTGPENYNPNIEPGQLPSQTDPSVDQPMGNFYDWGGFDAGTPEFYPTSPYAWDYQQSGQADVNPNFAAMLHTGEVTKPHASGGVIKRGYQDGGVTYPSTKSKPTPKPTPHQFDPQPVPIDRGPGHPNFFDPRFSRSQYELMAADGGVMPDRSHPVWMPDRSGNTGTQDQAPDNPMRMGGIVRGYQDGGVADEQADKPPDSSQTRQIHLPPQLQQMLHQHLMQALAQPLQIDQPRQPAKSAGYAEGGVAPPLMPQAPQQQSSPVAGEPTQKPKQQPKPIGPYEFGPADYFYTPEMFKQLIAAQTAAIEQGQGGPAVQQRGGGGGGKGGYAEGGVIPKHFMQFLAEGGIVKEFTPDHHLMFSLGMAHGLSASQAAKRLGNGSPANPLPP